MTVVSIKGDVLPDGRQPVQPVVDALEELLRRARAGELVGMVYAFQYHDAATGANCVGRLSYAMVGRLEEEKRQVLDYLARD